MLLSYGDRISFVASVLSHGLLRYGLKIYALLAPVTLLEFSALREQLDVSDSVLSKHFKPLDEAGYVVVNKSASEGRQRTWLSLSPEGRKAFKEHLDA